MKYRIELVRSQSVLFRQKWFWRIVDMSNHKTIAHSETYARRIDAMATAAGVATALGATVMEVNLQAQRGRIET